MSEQTTQEVLADRDYWKSFIKDDNYQLYGFTYRDGASFMHKTAGGIIEVNKSHIQMLGLNSAPDKQDSDG